MNKMIIKFAATLALAVATSGLGANVAGAQTVQRVSFDRINTPVLRADDFVNVRLATPRPVVVDDVAWPAAVAAVAGAIYAAVELVHRVTESWMPPAVSLAQRGNLVNLGVYDR